MVKGVIEALYYGGGGVWWCVVVVVMMVAMNLVRASELL